MTNYNHKDVEITNKEIIYQGFLRLERIFLRHRLFSGEWSKTLERELLVRHRVAAALPYDPHLNKVVLVEQFRYGALEDEKSPWLIELAAGILTDKNETLDHLAKRETKEETGLAVKELIPICDYWSSPGGSNERVALFCALVDANNAGGIHGLADEHEDIKVSTFNAEEAFAMVRDGTINNAATIIALQWLELNLARFSKK